MGRASKQQHGVPTEKDAAKKGAKSCVARMILDKERNDKVVQNRLGRRRAKRRQERKG